MTKEKTSNLINRLGCGTEYLYCTRVYVNARTYGGAWIPMEWFLDNIFYLFKGEKQHCRSCYVWERRHYGKTKKQTNQVRSEKTERETSGDEAS